MVTSVFRQYETGLREGVIDVKEVLFFSLIIIIYVNYFWNNKQNLQDLHTALMALGLNPLEQEVIDMTNEVAR